MVWRAQHAKSYTFSGHHDGRKMISGGSVGSIDQSHSPKSASQIRVKTRARSMPPASRTNATAFCMWSASTGSPARRSAV